MPTEPNFFLSAPPHDGHTVSGSSLNACWASRSWPQSLQRYSYVGIEGPPHPPAADVRAPLSGRAAASTLVS